jgi:hypothetical protein
LKRVDKFASVGIVGDRIYRKVSPVQVTLQAVPFLLSKVNCGILEDNSSNLPLGI